MKSHEELCALLRAKSTIDPLRVLEAVRSREAQIAERAKRRSGVDLTALAFGLVALLLFAIVFADPLTGAAFALYVAAAVPYTLLLRRHGRAAEPPAPQAPLAQHVAHYRAELERERALFPRLGGYTLPLVASVLLAYAGARPSLRATGVDMAGIDAIVGAVSLLALALLAVGLFTTLRTRGQLGREIAALEG